jgi:hypothetical protein
MRGDCAAQAASPDRAGKLPLPRRPPVLALPPLCRRRASRPRRAVVRRQQRNRGQAARRARAAATAAAPRAAAQGCCRHAPGPAAAAAAALQQRSVVERVVVGVGVHLCKGRRTGRRPKSRLRVDGRWQRGVRAGLCPGAVQPRTLAARVLRTSGPGCPPHLPPPGLRRRRRCLLPPFAGCRHRHQSLAGPRPQPAPPLAQERPRAMPRPAGCCCARRPRQGLLLTLLPRPCCRR